MGKFACHCGYVISDSSSPCPWAGELKWEPEQDAQSEKVQLDVAAFLVSREKGKSEDWIRNYFGDEYMNIYPAKIKVAEVIDDIYMRVSSEAGHSVYQCPECERLYIQKQFYIDEWTCFEKRK